MKITITYTEKEKILHKAIKDTIIGGLTAIGKYVLLFLIVYGLPAWMLFDYFTK